MKGKRRIGITLLTVCLLAGLWSLTCMAKGAEKTGSIRIILREMEAKKSSPKGVEFHLWKVGTVDENGTPVFDGAYGMTDYPQEGSALDQAAGKILGMIAREPDRKGTTNEQGVVQFDEITRGIYLLQAAENNPYGIIAPFLVNLPYWDDLAGTFLYEIQSEPKASPYPDKKPEKDDPVPAPKPPSPEKAPDVKTGDQTPIMGYILLMIAALAVITGTVLLSRKRKGTKKEGESYEE